MSYTTMTRAAAARIARLGHGERGMATAEYAIATLAAVAFAAVLLSVMQSNPIESGIKDIIMTIFKKK